MDQDKKSETERNKTDHDKKGETEQSASKNGTGFRLREQGVGDECGKVPVPVREGEEFVNGEIWVSVGRKENVGDII